MVLVVHINEIQISEGSYNKNYADVTSYEYLFSRSTSEKYFIPIYYTREAGLNANSVHGN